MVFFDTHQVSHRMKTRISKQSVEFQGILRPGYGKYIVRDALVEYVNDRWVLKASSQTQVIPRQEWSTGGMLVTIETCSGLGAMGKGFEFAGVRTMAMNDCNQIMCELAGKHRPHIPTVCGDIGSLDTVMVLAQMSEWPVSLGAGVACQPYSKLGDQGANHDMRSQSLPATLRAGYLLEAPVIYLECVEQAHHHPWVQSVLSQFAQQTGYSISQTVLELDHLWVSRRTRWWCVLSHPELGGVDLHPMPRLEEPAVIGDVLQSFLECSTAELQCLECDLYEVRTFKDFGGLESSVASLTATCRTCLHSCGSQLSKCPCGCRSSAFTAKRLEEKGLHGILVPLGGLLQHTNGDTYPRVRHVHPWELSLLNGLPPNWDWSSNLKLALVGVGQLASPIQAVWIASQVVQTFRRQGLLREQLPQPREALGNLMLRLFSCRDAVGGSSPKSDRLVEFERKIFTALGLMPLNFDKGLSPPKGEQKSNDKSVHKPAGWVDQQNVAVAPQGIKKQVTEDAASINDTHQAHPASGLQTTKALSPRDTIALQSKGAVPGFGSQGATDAVTSPKLAETDQAEEGSQASTVPYDEEGKRANHSDAMLQIWVQGIGQQDIHPIRVKAGTTVGTVMQAEYSIEASQAILTPTSWMGQAWALGSEVFEDQIILARPGTTWNPARCPVNGGVAPVFHEHETRLNTLLHQEAWMAIDEFNFYLSEWEVNGSYAVYPAGEFHPEQEWSHQIQQWLGTDPFVAKGVCLHGQGITTAVLSLGHWIPVVMTLGEAGIILHIPPSNPELVQAISQWAGTTKCTPVEVPVPTMFRADCGWQALSWLMAVSEATTVGAMHPAEAIYMRTKFRQHLKQSGSAYEAGGILKVGGMISPGELQNKLCTILQDRGVPPDQRNARAEQITQQIGTQKVTQALQSQRPWQELKQLANQCQPKLQLVLPSELQQQIAARAATQVPVSRNRNKINEVDKVGKPPPQIHAKDILIPHGVFRQSDGTLLSQLQMSEIGKTCKGILVQDQQEGAILLKTTRPVTNEGLGLIIIPPTPQADTARQLKFPAHFRSTEEPIILLGELHQLGEQQVLRNLPEQQLAIEETATEVIRVMAFRDEVTSDWGEFKAQPVRNLLTHLQLDGKQGLSQSGVLDVWDRQWVTHRFERVRPDQASVFIVNLRLEASKMQEVLQKSGDKGIYVEPRAAHGRGQNQEYAVTWLPKSTTAAEAKVACQTSPHPATLARVGTRYGLRSDVYHQQAMHRQYKPDAMFLPGGERQLYLMGPLPYGTTHQSLAKILTAWEWEARPLQPKGRTSDGSGAQWVIQATSPPSHWVYTLKHGDVLITTMPAKPNVPVPGVSFVASKKTLIAAEDRTDPWQIKDPWSQASTSAASSSTINSQGVTPSQLAALEEAVQSKVVATLKAQQDQDVHMEGNLDSRVAKLEAHLETMQQAQQATDTKVCNLQGQMEAQTQAFKQHITSELAGHMAQMETHMTALFAKARRLE